MTEGEKKTGMGNLTARILTSVVVIPVLLAVIFWKRTEVWWGMVFVASALGGWELSAMTLGRSRVHDNIIAVLSCLLLGSAVYWLSDSHPELVLFLMVGLLMFLFLYCLYTTKTAKDAGARISGLFITAFYAGLLFPFVALLRRLPDGSWWVILALAATWLGDTGAYFAGRFLGKHKLFPEVSPKKTWEGALGGMISTMAAVLVVKIWFLQEIVFWEALFLGVAASIIGQSGDLCESLLKRSYGVKDSGGVLPGHGGIMDRVDALVFVSPLVYVFAVFVVYS